MKKKPTLLPSLGSLNDEEDVEGDFDRDAGDTVGVLEGAGVVVLFKSLGTFVRSGGWEASGTVGVLGSVKALTGWEGGSGRVVFGFLQYFQFI